MIIVSGDDVARLLPMRAAIEVIERTMVAVSAGKANLPLRNVVEVGGANRLGIMPGAMEEPACYGVKLISLFPGNPAKGHSSHLGTMVLFEPELGTPTAMVSADALTAVRTAAASAVATRALARNDAEVLTIIGTGEQAERHVEAMLSVRDITELRVAGRRAERADAFAAEMRSQHPELTISAGTDVGEAAKGADIICTVTSSKETLLFGDWVKPGTHVNAVGASVPSMREIDEDLVAKASLFVDYRPSAFAQAADIIMAIESGRIDASHVRGEIGEVLAGNVRGRRNDDAITLYRSLGVAAQDLACAEHVRLQAIERGLGTDVAFS